MERADVVTAGLEAARLTFADFFEGEKVDLYTALCLVTRDPHEAEDIAQEAFVRVLEHWERVAVMEEPRGYLYRTAMNVFRSRFRRAATVAKRAIHRTEADDAMAEVDSLDVTGRALATLPPRQRAAVVLTDLLGFPSAEAARMLGIRASTLRMHTSRAHAALKGTMVDD